jgi:hypothetical protein
MPRESTILVYRSTTTDIPTGLTFGEPAFSGLTRKLFVGDQTGNSVWVGAEITAGSIATNSTILVPTQSAVKTYVDGVVGGGSVVNSINGTGGNITITGDSGSQQVSVSGTTTTITNRLATVTATGVASFNTRDFTVGSTGHVRFIGITISDDINSNSQPVVPGTAFKIAGGHGVSTKLTDQGTLTVFNAGVTSFNGSTGAITVTGDGGSQQVSVSGTTTTITNRLATTTATGAASFSSTNFDVVAGAVSIKTGGVPNAALANSSFTLRDEVGGTDTISLGDTLTITGGRGVDFLRTGTDTYQVSGITATSSVLGVASFNSSDFTVSAGAVSLQSNIVKTSSSVASVNGATGAITVTGDGGSQQVSVSGTTTTITNRLATTSVTGVASFNTAHFTVTNGGVSLASNTIGVRGSVGGAGHPAALGTTLTVTSGGAINVQTSFDGSNVTLTVANTGVVSANGATGAITVTGDAGSQQVSVSGATTTLTNRLATTSVTGVASFNSADFTVSAGAVSLQSNIVKTSSSVASVNGATGAITITGDAGSQQVSVSGTTTTITNRLATTSVTGVASFSSSNFDVAAGAVSIKNNGVPNTALANSSFVVSAGSNNTIALGGTLTLTGTANQVSVSSNGSGTVTLGLPNDITIPGNLTVNGTVVTANVDNFTVEDPMIALGTGNAGDSLDLGFYGRYVSTGTRFAGLFRDASDSGKFKLFAGLTAEPTTFVDNAFPSFAVATLVAKIDGGTF